MVAARHGESRSGAAWFVIAGLLTIAVVALPAAVARSLTGTSLTVAALPGTVAAGFEQWVRTGQASSAPLAPAVSFWAVFHVVKAVVAALLLVTLIPVGRQVWNAYERARSRGRRARLRAIGGLGSLAVPLLVLVVMANVQGAVAPLSSVLTFLPMDGPAVTQVRDQLASGRMTPPSTTLVADFRLYHAALVAAAVVAIGLGSAATTTLWVQRARMHESRRRLRRVLAVGGMIIPVMLLLLGVVLLANVSTVADTTPALAAFFDGSGT